jgi:hypothetical protein
VSTARRYEENLAKVEAHLEAEFSNDIGRIMDSVAPTPRFAILSREGGALELEVAETRDTVRAHYENLRSALDVVRSRQIRRLVSDWFVFQQSVATLRTRPGTGGPAAGPHDFSVDTAVLFPLAPAGILGEIPWNRTSFAEAMSAPSHHHEPPTEELMDTVDRHEAFLKAWCSGRAAQVMDLLDDDCALAVRSLTRRDGSLCTATGRHRVSAALLEQFRVWKPAAWTILNLVVTDWFTFANVRWVGELRAASGRWSSQEVSTATLLPISAALRYRAILGYGTAPEPL